MLFDRIYWRWIVCVCLVLVPKDLYAAQTRLEAPFLEHERAIGDNPREVLKWAQSQLQVITPELHPHEWVRLLIIENLALTTSGLLDSNQNIPKALSIAEERAYKEENVYLLLSLSETELNLTKREELLRNAVSLARDIGHNRLLVRSLASLALFFHQTQTNEIEALRTYREAQDIIKNDPQFDRMEEIFTRVKIGLMMDDVKMGGEKTVQAFEDILSEFRELGLRYFQSIMMLNIAATLKSELKEKIRSRQYFQELLKLSSEIENGSTYGTALAYLADYDIEESNYAAAEKKLQEAEKILSKDYPVTYLEFLLDFLWNYHHHRKNWSEGLKTLDKAEPLIPKNDFQKARNFEEKKYRTLARLGRFESAYAIVSKLYFDFKNNKETQDKEGLSKLKVELGLAVEEQKTKTLEKENQLQSEKFKNFRRFQFAAVAIGLLSIATLSLIVYIRSQKQLVSVMKEKNEALAQKTELQEKLTEEWKVRAAMAARAAHHLNNPVNIIEGLNGIILKLNEDIRSNFTKLLPKPENMNAEATGIATLFSTKFDEISDCSAHVGSAIGRVSHVVKELQLISGVTGFSLERVSVSKIWREFKSYISSDEILSKKSLHWTDPPDSLQAEAFGHTTILARTFFYLIKEMLEEFDSQENISVRAEEFGSNETLLCFKILIGMEGSPRRSIPQKEWREFTLGHHIASSLGCQLAVINDKGFSLGLQIALDRIGDASKYIPSKPK